LPLLAPYNKFNTSPFTIATTLWYSASRCCVCSVGKERRRTNNKAQIKVVLFMKLIMELLKMPGIGLCKLFCCVE
jgi:hypothetical protein